MTERNRGAKSQAARYSAAVAWVAVAFLLRWLLSPLLGESAPFILFVAAAGGATYTGSIGAGIFATVLAALLGVYSFTPPELSGVFATPRDQLLTALFVVEGIVVSWLVSVRQRTNAVPSTARSLHRVAELYRLLVAQSAEYAMFVMDKSGAILSWNEGVRQVLGYRSDEFIGRNGSIIFTPEDREQAAPEREIETARRYGRAADNRWYLRSDGIRFWAHGVVQAHFDADGKVAAFSKVMRDDSEWKAIDDSRRESEERFRLLVERVQDSAIYMLDEHGCVTSWNQGATRIKGYIAEEVLGQPFSRFYPPDAVERGDPERAIRTAREQGSYSDEGWRVRKGGSRFYAENELVALYRDDGTIRGYAKITRDISDRKSLLDAEREARAAAESANRTKDEFIAVVSHELRTPLSAVLGWVHLLRKRMPPKQEDLEHGLSVIDRNVRAQAQLIDDLLDVSRIVAGKLRLDVVPTDLESVLEAAVASVRLIADHKGVAIQVHSNEELLTVQGDATRLQQAVVNLLTNSVKFTDSGGSVTVTLHRAGHRAEIEVRDTGIGIPPDMLPHVFERFRQVDTGNTRRFGGLGLGLNIVRHLVELHGGSVRASSDGIGKGSTFVVTLPLLEEPRTIGHFPSVIQSVAAIEEQRATDLSGVRVLVVEDDDDARELIVKALADCHAEVLEGASAEEGVQLVQREHPDVLVSDISMPVIDGYEFLHRVRALPVEQGGQVPAIALTAFAGELEHRRALDAGYSVHLLKPVTSDQLAAVVGNVAGSRV